MEERRYGQGGSRYGTRRDKLVTLEHSIGRMLMRMDGYQVCVTAEQPGRERQTILGRTCHKTDRRLRRMRRSWEDSLGNSNETE